MCSEMECLKAIMCVMEQEKSCKLRIKQKFIWMFSWASKNGV